MSSRAVLAAVIALGLAAAPAAAASPNGIGDPYFPQQGNRGWDALSYRADLDINPGTNDVVADITIHGRAKRVLRSFHLDYLGPKPDSIKVRGKRATFTRNGVELIVQPARPVRRGKRFVTEVAYAGKPQSITGKDGITEGWVKTGDGTAALGEPQGTPTWLPCNNHPTDKAKFTFEITVPDTHKAVANGSLVSTTSEGGKTTYVWRGTEPMASYLAVVTTGLYDLQESTIAGIPSWIAIDPSQSLLTDLSEMGSIHEFLADTFGPYPFSSTGAIVDAAPFLGYALETQNRPYYSFAPSGDLIVHELAHEWYGDSVSPRRWRHIWLNEGFATYAEWLWAEDQGDQTAQERFDEEYSTDSSDSGFWGPKPGNPGKAALFDDTVYTRGAMTLHAIRTEIGDDDFFELMPRWASRYRYRTATTTLFKRMAEAVSGEQLDKLFHDWLFTATKPPAPTP